MKKIILRLLLNSLALYLTSILITQCGLKFELKGFLDAILAMIVLGLINTFIRPIFAILTLPLNILTLGLFSIVINAFMLKLTDYFLDGFTIEGFLAALLGAVILGVISTILNFFIK